MNQESTIPVHPSAIRAAQAAIYSLLRMPYSDSAIQQGKLAVDLLGEYLPRAEDWDIDDRSEEP